MSCLLTQGKMDTDANFSCGELLPVSCLCIAGVVLASDAFLCFNLCAPVDN